MHVGIDLGTTFCCMAYVDQDGIAKVIPSSDNEMTTPSIIYFDGNSAMVGAKAEQAKNVPMMSQHIYEFVKRDIGKPIEMSPMIPEDERDEIEIKPYEINGFKYGAAGMSAIILRKLKTEAIRFLKNRHLLPSDAQEKTFPLDAVITVPAYFGEKERQDTRLAGFAAGLNVIGIINEPTAAALAYGLTRQEKKKVLVFDLGGGTFDVTILEVSHNDATVLATDGANTLGGKNWDELIQEYIYNVFSVKNNREIPDEHGFFIQHKALKAKFALSENDETRVSILLNEGELDSVLYRSRPESECLSDIYDMSDDKFYFEEVSTSLLSLCQTICSRVVLQAGLTWRDLDEVVLAGGSCRMPMISKMLEKLTGWQIRHSIEGFSYDTAIAIGAAYFGQHSSSVKDVLSHSIGVRIYEKDHYTIDHFILKNSRLPVSESRTYPADANAVLSVWEGESKQPDECTLRGRIELDNPEGEVTIKMEADTNGFLKITAEYPPHGQKVLEIKNESFMFDERGEPLKEKIQAIHLNL